jgi:hypothetical protein
MGANEKNWIPAFAGMTSYGGERPERHPGFGRMRSKKHRQELDPGLRRDDGRVAE